MTGAGLKVSLAQNITMNEIKGSHHNKHQNAEKNTQKKNSKELKTHLNKPQKLFKPKKKWKQKKLQWLNKIVGRISYP